MELTHRAYKVSRFAPEDVISSMPDNVLTNIMDRLPLQEGVRTSILSRNWRFKWTMVSQLVFDKDFFKYLSVTKGEKEHGQIITSLLLQLSGTVTKFVLSIGKKSCSVSDQDISLWILFLSKKRLEDLTLLKMNGKFIKLPTHLFSCLELKHLKLSRCHFDPPVTFHGFPNLLSLELSDVQSKSSFGDFISQCPALEILKIGLMYPVPIEGHILKLVDIAKLANLKILSLLLCVLRDTEITSSNRLFELVGSLPKLEELNLAFVMFKDDIPAQQPTPSICSRAANFATMRLLQLQRAFFMNASEKENDVRLIEYVLACSPSLRQIVICPCQHLSSDEKFKLSKKLLALKRASPNAKVYI